ncbi:MAG: glycosyltransferase [Acidobacteriota bacterium]|nr:glycosyltransferase [Acidobacteriota bacterium]
MSSQEIETQIRNAPPLVSVSITTYNLEKWLPRALDSVLAQRTTFPFEIVIGDDGSQDDSVKVAQSYRERHPDVIRVLVRDKNVGIQRNTYDTLAACRGKYTAWLDADDYWTDLEKLAIQVETLESDPTISMCGHFTREVTVEGQINRPRVLSTLAPGRYGIDELLRHNLMTPASVMFRTGLHRQLPPWYFDLKSLSDWPLWVLATGSGDIVLLDRIMADCMLAPNSSFMSQSLVFRYQMVAQFYQHVESIVPSKWHRLVRAQKGTTFESIAYFLRQQGDFIASRKAAVKAFRSPALMDNLGSKSKALLASVVRESQWRLRGRRAKPAQ